MDKTLLFLIKLAWESRLKLPLLITIGFMILDIRMQLEITIETRRVRRARVIPIDPDVDNIPEDEDDDDLSERESNTSWSTVDEEVLEQAANNVPHPSTASHLNLYSPAMPD